MTSGQPPQFMVNDTTTVVDKLQQSDRRHFAEFYSRSGRGIGFYADEHINVLLNAVETRNYGRVLAKPRVLVNDNERGTIKTADTTYVVTKSSVSVIGGSAGALANGYEDLKRISEENRAAFERHEQKFQEYRTWPGGKREPMSPERVLEAR